MGPKDIILLAAAVIAAALLIFKFSKEHKVCIVLGVLCLMYGGYYTANLLMGPCTLVSVFAWVLRAAAVISVVLMILALRGERNGEVTESDHKE